MSSLREPTSTGYEYEGQQRNAEVWDPFFGPPVKFGEGGAGWKSDGISSKQLSYRNNEHAGDPHGCPPQQHFVSNQSTHPI